MESAVRELLRTAKLLRLCMEEALAEAGGSFATFAILDAINIEPGLSQREIARRLSIEGPSVTRHLDHLEAEGYIERRSDPTDRRLTRIFVTDTGREHYLTLCPIVRGKEETLFASTNPAQLETFRTMLHDLYTRLREQD
jgi:MarR family transcriptional regulator, transcriptional regulator for hemolysin